jgi:hypothetical protein
MKTTDKRNSLNDYEIWKKVEKEKLSKEQHKQLLIDNGVLIVKGKNK